MQRRSDILKLMIDRWPELRTDEGPEEERIALHCDEVFHRYIFRLGRIISKFEPVILNKPDKPAFLFDAESKIYIPTEMRENLFLQFLEKGLMLGGKMTTKAGITGTVRYMDYDAPFRSLNKKDRRRFKRFYALDFPDNGLAHVYKFNMPDRFYHHVAVNDPLVFMGITKLSHYLEAPGVARSIAEGYKKYISNDRVMPVRDTYLKYIINKYCFLPYLKKYESYSRYKLSLTYF